MTKKKKPEDLLKVGRPSTFKDEYIHQAQVLTQNGATNSDLAKFFDVHVRTINKWKVQIPEFGQACKVGWASALDRVESSLLELALGQTLEDEHEDFEETIDAEGKRTSKTKTRRSRRQTAPNIQAINTILTNLSDKWAGEGSKVTIDVQHDPEHVARSYLNKVLKDLL